MKRRHLLALIILALVVATVMAVGPVRVWDWMRLRTVVVVGEHGEKTTYRVRWWDDSGYENAVGPVRTWYPTGELCGILSRSEHGSPRTLRGGTKGGKLNTYLVWDGNGQLSGIEASESPYPGPVKQSRYLNGEVVETRNSPPWFTEEEILQSVEGLEE